MRAWRLSVPAARRMSLGLGEDVFAEESYLFDEIGQACHLAVRPHFEWNASVKERSAWSSPAGA
jgi:hypothetical protein